MTQRASSEKRLGAVLDEKWCLTELIGEGGMATVYGAVHLRNGGAVAIKVLSPASASDAPLAARFLTEGYVANRVGHKGCVRVLDDGRTPEGTPYIVMERLVGSTLDGLAHGGALPVDDVLRYGLALADVLAAAHAAGIVHRDIKPENVFLCDDGTVKVLDFGIAQLKGFVQEARITVAGQTLGTPAFMPPEQVMGQWERVGPASDVYAAGGTLFNLVTGEFPHEAETAQEFMVRTATERARPVRSLRPEIPQVFAEVIDRCLAHAPDERYANGAALLEALRAVQLEATAGGGRLETLRSPLGAAPASTARGPLRVAPSSYAGDEAKTLARVTTAPVSSASRARAKRSWATPAAIGAFAVVGVATGAEMYARESGHREAAASTTSIEEGHAATREAPSTATPTGERSVVSVVAAPSVIPSAAEAAVSAGPAAPSSSAPRLAQGAPMKSPAAHEAPMARPTSTPAPAQHPPDPSDPLGFH